MSNIKTRVIVALILTPTAVTVSGRIAGVFEHRTVHLIPQHN
jgi:hypothetical protein